VPGHGHWPERQGAAPRSEVSPSGKALRHGARCHRAERIVVKPLAAWVCAGVGVHMQDSAGWGVGVRGRGCAVCTCRALQAWAWVCAGVGVHVPGSACAWAWVCACVATTPSTNLKGASPQARKSLFIGLLRPNHTHSTEHPPHTHAHPPPTMHPHPPRTYTHILPPRREPSATHAPPPHLPGALAHTRTFP